MGSFNTNHQQLAMRKGAIVEILMGNGVSGIGEIAPLPEFAGGDLQDALSHLSLIAERLRNQDITEALAILHKEYDTLSSSAACYGVETALLDVQGQVEQRSLSEILARSATLGGHPIRSSIPVNAVIGGMSAEAAAGRAREAVAAGFRCIKLKVGRETEVEIARVEAVRAAIGPDIQLRLDANEGWTREQAVTILARCADCDIQYVEQPLSREDLEGMRLLRQKVPVAIAADEALSGPNSAERVLAAGAADVFIVKPQLAGGLYHAQRMLQGAAERGVKCVITSSIEAGIGIAAALHLAAASPEVTWACGLGTLAMLENDLIDGALPVSNGNMGVPTGPGLGVRLDREALRACSSS